MSTINKAVFIMGLMLLIYGYLCRYFSIYFFWDSKYFGWLGIISGLLLLLIDIRMIRIRQRQNIFFVRVFVAVIIIFLALEGSAIVWLKSSTPYDDLIESIKTDDVIKAEIGDIRGFNLVPGISVIDILQVPSSGSLSFVITARGQKAHRDIEVNIENTLGINWRVISTQPINYR